MSPTLASQAAYGGHEAAAARAWLKAAGLTDTELKRPLVAIVNCWSELAPENYHLRMVGDAVKAGVRIAGGTPLEFNTIHVVDAVVMALEGMRGVLPSRELVADSVEVMVRSHQFDGMVLIPSGDKVVPAMVMAAARLNVPSIVLHGGVTESGKYKGRTIKLEEMWEAVGAFKAGKISEEELRGLEDNAFPGFGGGAGCLHGEHDGHAHRGHGHVAAAYLDIKCGDSFSVAGGQRNRHADHAVDRIGNHSLKDYHARRLVERCPNNSCDRGIHQFGAAPAGHCP